jgi:hypothetical protein
MMESYGMYYERKRWWKEEGAVMYGRKWKSTMFFGGEVAPAFTFPT